MGPDSSSYSSPPSSDPPDAAGEFATPETGSCEIEPVIEEAKGFRQLAKQLRQYQYDPSNERLESINNPQNKPYGQVPSHRIDQYLSHPTFGLGTTQKKKPRQSTPGSVSSEIETLFPKSTLPNPLPQRSNRQEVQRAIPVKASPSGGPKLVRFVSPFRMNDPEAMENEPAEGGPALEELYSIAKKPAPRKPIAQAQVEDETPLPYYQARALDAPTRYSTPQEHTPQAEFPYAEFSEYAQTESLRPSPPAPSSGLATARLQQMQEELAQRLEEIEAAQEELTQECSQEASPPPEAPSYNATPQRPSRIQSAPDVQFLQDHSDPRLYQGQGDPVEDMAMEGAAQEEGGPEYRSIDDSGLDLALANARLEEALPPPMMTSNIHQRIQEQAQVMDFSNFYREVDGDSLPPIPVNPAEYFDEDLLHELHWEVPAEARTKAVQRKPLAFGEKVPLDMDEARFLMHKHLNDLREKEAAQSIAPTPAPANPPIDKAPPMARECKQNDIKGKKLLINSGFGDTLSSTEDEGKPLSVRDKSRRTTARSNSAPCEQAPENFVVQGVKLKEIRSMGGSMSNLSGYKDLSKAPAAFGEEEKQELASSALAANFAHAAPSLAHETFNPAEIVNPGVPAPVVETDYNSNFQTLIRLINELPEGVTKQTGAQIIRLTMESMGIFMEDVLSDAQAAQSEMLDAVRANIKKIEEYKTIIRKLESDIKYYQTKANELSEIIDLFILSNSSGKSSID